MMGSVWGLAVPLLVFYWKAEASVNSPGLSIRSVPLGTTNSTEVPAFTQRARPSSERTSQTTNLTQNVPVDTETLSTETASNALIAASTHSEVSSRGTQISSVTKTRKTHTATPAAASLETQATSPNVSTLNIQTTSPTASSLDSLTTSPAPSLTTSPAPSLSTSPASSPTTSPAPSLSTSPAPSLTTSPAPSLSTSPAPSLTTSPAPSLTTSPASSLTTSPAPSLTTSPASSPTTSPAPSLSTSPAPSLTTSPAPSLSTSPAPSLTTSPAPSLTTSPASSLTTSPAPSLTTSPAPSLTTSPAPSLSTSPAPSLTTSPAPSLTTSPASSLSTSPASSPTTSPAPSLSTFPAPSLSTSPAPFLTTSPAPSLSTFPAPSLSTSPAPSLTTSPASSLTTSPAPSLTTSPAPSLSTSPAPSLTTFPAPSLTTSPAPSLTTSPAPSLSTSPAPSLSTSPAPSLTTSPASSLTTSPEPSSLGKQTILPVELTLKTQTIFSGAETRTLLIRMPSNFTVAHTIPTETLAPRESPRTGMSTVKTGAVSDPIEAIFDTLCPDDSSEEAKKITADLLTLAHTSTEVEHLSSESRSSSDSTAGVLGSTRDLGPDNATPAKGLVTFSITHIKLATCITEIETTVTISGIPDESHSPTEVMAPLSVPETLMLPPPTEAKPIIAKTTSSSRSLSTTSTPALTTTLEGTLSTSGITENGPAETQTLTSGGTWVTVRRNPLEDTSALSIETQSHTEALGTITVPTVAGSMGEVTSSVSATAPDSSLPAVATSKSSITSETLTTDKTTSSSFLTGSHPPSFSYSTTASTSKNPNITLTNTTASPKPPTNPASTAWTRKNTTHDPGEDGGFLLVRLTVASPKHLPEHISREKLMYQLRCELHTHMLLVQVSLLSIRRS